MTDPHMMALAATLQRAILERDEARAERDRARATAVELEQGLDYARQRAGYTHCIRCGVAVETLVDGIYLDELSTDGLPTRQICATDGQPHEVKYEFASDELNEVPVPLRWMFGLVEEDGPLL